ncbi:hypothetical protein SeMB42_g07098 [Synchytrium endobioticum]|uniref:DNA/RNA-binding protein Kin17 WH-like domain-containing protein n=1 Tax=Synchytrium endobioticum TaxID=286115 RepID=A0A507DDH9_9FUNG|nr:hypothetical protein SeMB42_g07098 [Synchytrium endobioticum]TPX49742.1 hypothetical protein SeLEV6574_g01303 [Synchytrium endobioticum]
MGKDGFLTPKAIANRIKAKGLQKLRWYCQMCEKQCRDENGFKCHCASEAHQRQMALFAENPHRFLEDYSRQFLEDFLKLISRRYNTQRVNGNLVYQEYISDRNHLHMNATRWSSLTQFLQYLGREGICEVDETEKGWFIKWIDRSPETLARQEAIRAKERSERSDADREQKMLEEQIEKAKTAGKAAEAQYTELQRETQEDKIKLDLNLKTGFQKPLLKKAEPKKMNALAMASKMSAETSKGSSSGAISSTPTLGKRMSEVERLIEEERHKKQRLLSTFKR